MDRSEHNCGVGVLLQPSHVLWFLGFRGKCLYLPSYSNANPCPSSLLLFETGSRISKLAFHQLSHLYLLSARISGVYHLIHFMWYRGLSPGLHVCWASALLCSPRSFFLTTVLRDGKRSKKTENTNTITAQQQGSFLGRPSPH